MVTFQKDGYAHSSIVYAFVDRDCFAHYQPNGNACSVRWWHLDHPTKGYIENFPSVEAARAAIEAFWASLDFVPWDEDGRPTSHTGLSSPSSPYTD